MALNMSNNGFAIGTLLPFKENCVTWKSIALIFILIILTSCRKKEDILFSQFIQLNNAEMMSEENYVFPTDVIDSLTLSDPRAQSFLMIRYNDLCDISELPLKVEYTSKETSIDTLDMKLPLFIEGLHEKEKRDAFGVYEEKILLPFIPDNQSGGFISVSSNGSNVKGVLALGILIIRKK